MSTEKLIIDTDIGDDIDDALAIALALKSPEVEIIGVTTVFKNTEARAKLAKKLLVTAGYDNVPVYAGCKQPLLNRVDDKEIFNQYSDDLEDIEIDKETNAVDFIIKAAMNNEGITIAAIAPLTNLAVALTKKPEIKKGIKKIVLMGGAYYKHANEWNILCDPEAAKIVFESGIEIVAIGLDVTLECRMSDEHFAQLKDIKNPMAIMLSELIGKWKNFMNWPVILHDPLAICAVYNAELFEMRQEEIHIETKGEFSRGTTFNKSNAEWWNSQNSNSNILVAKRVNSDNFVELFINRLLS